MCDRPMSSDPSGELGPVAVWRPLSYRAAALGFAAKYGAITLAATVQVTEYIACLEDLPGDAGEMPKQGRSFAQLLQSG